MLRRLPEALVWLALLAVAVLPTVSLAQQDVIQDIHIFGSRRIPAESIRARMTSTKPGDAYDPASLERDFNSLWNTGYFEDIRFERQESPKGWIINVYVKEKPTIRSLDYKGLNSVSTSDVLDRFKERKVGLTVENQYDPTKIKKAEVTIKELLAEHGRQFATVRSEIHPIPPAAVGVTFVVHEGPKVKVGKIRFEGNKHLKTRELRAAMKNLRPIGVPHSIFLENLMSRTYDASKLSEDTERVRDAYQQKGYFKVLVEDPRTKLRDTGGGGFHLPFMKHGPGKAVDITIPIDEGDRYRLASITFKGNKAISNTKALRAAFPMKDGDIFDTDKVRKGLENLRKEYGAGGYINFTPVPDTKIDDEKKMISLAIDIDEGKQYYVRRIEFQGNTTTRDKVIRRELAVEEGQFYNSRLWDFSVLRLNQLGYFEQLKPEDADTKRNDKDATVDITLKVREKGKNSISLSGGVSGLAGGYVGINYSTNNFLGLGETLSVSANVGNRERSAQFGFTEPYLFDRPIQFGFSVFTSRFNFDQANQAQLLSGVALNVPGAVLNTLQNYTQSTTGFTVNSSYTLRHSLKHLALTYSFDSSSITTFSDASKQLFEFLAFRNVSGPNALQGVLTSKVVPSFSVSNVDSAYRPNSGHSLFIGGEVAGLGGNVRDVRPVVEYKKFIPVYHHRNVLGYRLQGSFISGYGGRAAPPFERFYLGGDSDLRGFDIRSISPVTFLADTVSFPLLNPDGSPVPRDPSNPRLGSVTVPIPIQRVIFPGGDTSLVSNVEYRIPIVGPVAVAAFVDTGLNFVARPSQLRITPTQVTTLDTTSFGCPALVSFTCVGGQSLNFTPNLTTVGSTNFVPRMSTGLELQVLMPIINQPVRVYYAYNPLALDTLIHTPNQITRSMFPPGGAGDFTFAQALASFAPDYRLREPRKTFRVAISTTF
jgi:outer membrane protein insertion porin family